MFGTICEIEIIISKKFSFRSKACMNLFFDLDHP